MTQLYLYVAQCPGCQAWFSLGEPVQGESRALMLARLGGTLNLEARCPYCGRGYRLEELLERRWLKCTEEPAE